MNLMRTSVFGGALLVGVLVLGGSPARAQVAGVAVPAAARRYTYTQPPATPLGGSNYAAAPSRRSWVLRPSRTSHQTRPFRDPTGRDIPLAKPWLQPW
jgi:hypothetical protein